MPAFRPFQGILPRPECAANAILPANACWDERLHAIVPGENAQSFHHILQAADPDLPERALAAACAQSARVFDNYLQRGQYQRDEHPAYYLYFTRYRGIEQTGIIGLCEAADLTNQRIKKHEHTRNDRVNQLYTFLEHTGLFTTPVFLTYHPQHDIDALIHRIKQQPPLLHVHSGIATDHRIWRIDQPADLALVGTQFGNMDAFYIADGHHRAAIAEKYQQLHPEKGGAMLSILIASNNLTIFPFYRRILNDQGPVNLWDLLDLVRKDYQIRPCSIEQMYYQYLPAQHFLLCTAEASWLLIPKNPHLRGDVLADLDVSILQHEIIGPHLGITDPKADTRINFGPMSLPLEAFKQLLRQPETAMIFICRAPLADVIFKVADENQVMPPKSTSFEPKILSGLVLHQVSA
jgi:uncharacterized protein (DUF1015 family)